MDRKLVLILSEESISWYICKNHSELRADIVFSDQSNGLVNFIQYNSWFRKLPNLHKAMHNGNMHASRSNKITYSFREKFLFLRNIDTIIKTQIIHQMKDIHHCRILNISIGLFIKLFKSYMKTCQSLHHIKTHKISIINKDSKSFSIRFCK